MRKKSVITVAMVITVCCFAIFLTGCSTNSNNNNQNGTSVENPSPTPTPNNGEVVEPPETTSPTQTEPPTQTPTPSGEIEPPDTTPPTETETPTQTTTPSGEEQPPQTTTPSGEEQPPDTTPSTQTEPEPPTQTPTPSPSGGTLEIGLPDGTEVRLIVSGREIAHLGVVIGGEVLVPDFNYVFGNLLDADGNRAGFWGVGVTGAAGAAYRATIFNDSYHVTIVEGEYSFTVNDESRPLTVPAQMINRTIYVPLIAIADSIGATVEWNETERTISIFYGR